MHTLLNLHSLGTRIHFQSILFIFGRLIYCIIRYTPQANQINPFVENNVFAFPVLTK